MKAEPSAGQCFGCALPIRAGSSGEGYDRRRLATQQLSKLFRREVGLSEDGGHSARRQGPISVHGHGHEAYGAGPMQIVVAAAHMSELKAGALEREKQFSSTHARQTTHAVATSMSTTSGACSGVGTGILSFAAASK